MGSWRAVGLAVTACVVAVAVVLSPRADPPAGASPTAARGDDVRRAAALLADWDGRRAAAWAAQEPGELGRLYAPGSGAGAADVRLLRQWRDAGWRVDRLTLQVLSLRVLAASPGRVRLEVTDRVAGGRIESTTSGLSRPLPATRPVVRRLVLEQVGGVWRLSGSVPAPRARRP